MFVIGTAGHVDHGKSTLVQALTGINPDRLREERERQMTIDLGFAWLTLPSGREVSIIDVPGHEDFVKNMLAGVGGIDVALFVVAADEAVMPQTREHLAIIDLLRVPRGVVALTKADLIDDPDWLELAKEDVRDVLAGTVLEGAPLVAVSALTGQGLDELRATLDAVLDDTTPRRDLGRPRLPIDRVFTISGFGTVITGTLSDGAFAVGDDVEILPVDLTARVRGLQTHQTRVDRVLPGFRVAMNLGRVATEDLRRGQVVVAPGSLVPTTLIDARLETVRDLEHPIRHDDVVELHVGTARVEAVLRMLDSDALGAGETGLVQLRLTTESVVVVRGDRYILRLPSPSVTLGGGEVLLAHPQRRHRRHHPQVIALLTAVEGGSPREIVRHLLAAQPAATVRDLAAAGDLSPAEVSSALRALVREGAAVLLGEVDPSAEGPWPQDLGAATLESLGRLHQRVEHELARYHARYPLRSGMPREELRNRLHLDPSTYAGVMARAAAAGLVALAPTSVRLATHVPRLSGDLAQAVERLLSEFVQSPFSTPSPAQIEQEFGAPVLEYLLDSGRLIKVNDEVLYEAGVRADLERRVVEYLQAHGEITVAQVRDLFDTSRKYAVALLEDLDRRRVTRRVGDLRVLR